MQSELGLDLAHLCQLFANRLPQDRNPSIAPLIPADECEAEAACAEETVHIGDVHYWPEDEGMEGK